MEASNTALDPAAQIQRAEELAATKQRLFQARADNRELLRLMERNGLLTDEQRALLAKLYPVKTRGGAVVNDDDDDENTPDTAPETPAAA